MRKIIYDDYFEVALSGEYERAFPNIQESKIKLAINTVKNSGCYVEILERVAGEMLTMLCNHNKLFAMFFELRMTEFREYTGDNGVINPFNRILKKMG